MDYNKPSKARLGKQFYKELLGGKGQTPYQEETIEQKKLFLIICEGENTEPCYFNKFPVPTKTVVIEGGCNSRTALVDYAISIKDSEKNSGREVWCVFDYDVHPEQANTQPADFNNAIAKAYAHGMNVAWSNDAFELWFVLHYQKLDVSHTREELNEILKRNWKLKRFHGESKTKAFCEGHYERHGGEDSMTQKVAIKRAEELHAIYGAKADYANHCPCTTVYLLVKELNKNLKR